MKKILCALLSICIAAVLVVPYKTANASVSNFSVDTSRYTLLGETDEIMLYLNSESLAVKVADKKNGYVWSSDREISEEENLNQSWRNRINSGVTVEYYDTVLRKSGIATILGDQCQINITNLKNGASAEVFFTDLEIGFTLEFALSGNIVSAELKNESIKENTNVLRSITLLPFLGATNIDEFTNDGYLLIPDGSGALIEYGKRTVPVSNPYKISLYGTDLAPGLFATGYRATVPVYGIVNGIGKNAMYAEAEKGSAYGEIYAYASKVMLDYNWAGISFFYRQNYFQQTGKDGSGFSTIETDRAAFDIGMRYTFLSGAESDYVGIAKDYQKRLVDQGLLKESNAKEVDSYLHINVLGSEIKKSFLWMGSENYTTVEQTKSIIEDLLTQGITPTVSYMGYYNGGWSKFPLSKATFNKKLGSSNDFSDLISFANLSNVPLYFMGNYAEINYSASGVNKTRDLLRTVDQRVYSKVSNVNFAYDVTTSYLNYEKMKEQYGKDLPFFERNEMNIALDGVGSTLYSDYGINMNREAARIYLMEMFTGSNIKKAFTTPNVYMWGQTNTYLGIMTSSTRYTIFTKDVPFLQILLKGYIDYYSEPLNDKGDPHGNMLKMMEYGVYPSYNVTAESPINLINTPLSYIFSSEYNVWQEKIVDISKLAATVLGPVADAKIIGHMFEDGVSVTTYDNGMAVVVNYQNKEADYQGNIIEARSAIVCEVKS